MLGVLRNRLRRRTRTAALLSLLLVHGCLCLLPQASANSEAADSAAHEHHAQHGSHAQHHSDSGHDCCDDAAQPHCCDDDAATAFDQAKFDQGQDPHAVLPRVFGINMLASVRDRSPTLIGARSSQGPPLYLLCCAFRE